MKKEWCGPFHCRYYIMHFVLGCSYIYTYVYALRTNECVNVCMCSPLCGNKSLEGGEALLCKVGTVILFGRCDGVDGVSPAGLEVKLVLAAEINGMWGSICGVVDS